MKQKETFESRLKSKLESYEAQYDSKYWKAYSKTYHTRDYLAFLKLWYMPYIFSAILFGILWFWRGKPVLTRNTNTMSIQQSRVDTIYVKEFISSVDTIYIIEKDQTASLGRLPISNLRKNKTTNLIPVERLNEQQKWDEVAIEEGKTNSANQTSGSSNNELKNQFMAGEVIPVNDSLSDESTTMADSNNTNLNNKPTKEEDENNDTEVVVIEENKEEYTANNPQYLFIDSTDNLNDEAKTEREIKNLDFKFIAGPQLNFFTPFSSNNFDTYMGLFAGYGGSMYLNRFKFNTGLMFGFWLNEIDDLNKVDPIVLNNFPGIDQVIGTVDYIEVATTHFHIPMSMGYLLWEKFGFGLDLRFGVLGNYLITESFEYTFDGNDDEIRRNSGNNQTGFLFSHVNTGLSLNYVLKSDWSIETTAQYYQPINKLGRSNLNPAGLAIQFGFMKHF